MNLLSTAVLAASTVRSIGIVIALVAIAGFIVYALFNIRAGREEVGAEVELAANLKPYYDDDDLETTKLDRVLTYGLLGLVLVGIALPAYWIAEPGRQEGAIEEYDRVFATRGEELYIGACQSCHAAEGVGGVAPFTILDENNEFVALVNWKAPALDTVMLRYSEEEVTFILQYGRPFSPMPAWGTLGGGPYTDQEIENVIDYLFEITLDPEESRLAVEDELKNVLDVEVVDYDDPATGEALFNLGEESGFAGGAYACARCHTRGWSINENSAQPAAADLDPYTDYTDGSGGYGPMIQGVIPRQFASVDELTDFLINGAAAGQPYGNNGLSSGGMMPGFGDNPNTDAADDGMLSQEMVHAIARYVSTLSES